MSWTAFTRDDLVIQCWHFEEGWGDLQDYLQSRPYLLSNHSISPEGVVAALIGVTLGLLNSYIAQFADPDWEYWSNSKLGMDTWNTIVSICGQFVKDLAQSNLGLHRSSLFHSISIFKGPYHAIVMQI